MIPRVFPRCIYTMLLREVGSPHYQPPALVDLGLVSPQLAQSLEKMLQYDKDDIDEHFGHLEWPDRPEGPVTHENKAEFASKYIDWFFSGRFREQFDPFAGGFF